MALQSRHHEVLKAIRASIIADAEIVAIIPAVDWRIPKKPLHRTKSWAKGGLISPLRRLSPPHENQSDKIDFPAIVAIAWPNDQDLTVDIATQLALGERIENIFRDKGKSLAPYPLRNLESTFTGDNFFAFENVTVQPGEPYAESAFRDGYDAIVTIVTVTCIVNKLDSSTLGAP